MIAGGPIASYPLGAGPVSRGGVVAAVNLAVAACTQHATGTTASVTVTPKVAGVVNLIGSAAAQHSSSSTGTMSRAAKTFNLITSACRQFASSVTGAITRSRTDITTPVMAGNITVNTTGQTTSTISWQAASDNVGVVGYEYAVDGGAYTQLGNVLTVTVRGLAPSTQHTISVRAYDASGNKATPLTTTITTNSSSPDNPAYTASAARTVGVQAASRNFTGGKFWDLSDAKKPRGVKDPDSTIDITFDWSDWLADIGGANIASATFIIDGLDSNASYENNGKATVFVSGGVLGAATITCRITTDSTPSRIDDRTVYIDVVQE